MTVRGVVFDLDGTLVDNMAIHTEAFARFLAQRGLPPLDEAQRARLDGKRNTDIFPILLGRPLDAQELRAVSDEKEALYRDLSHGRLRPLRGLSRLLSILRAGHIPVAVATSGPVENVRHTLEETGLSAALDVIVRGDQVARGKPFPDIFLAAAARLGVPAQDCLAFEDTPAGVLSARAAGMCCVALTTSFSPAAFLGADAFPEHLVNDFETFLSGPAVALLGEHRLAEATS
jgi:beta-phosphoglucomutase